MKIGLISDTHGFLRPKALDALRESGLIIHGGDVGDPGILEDLRGIAPVVVVRGNIDTEEWCESLPSTAVAEAESKLIYVLHNLKDLDLNPAVAGFHIVLSGHTHKPARYEKDGVVYINPGSAGPRRFNLPITVARLELAHGAMDLDFVDCS